jgi:hypothetical protein
LVGYNIILGETETGVPIRLLSEEVLNGTILMILVTCTVSSLVVDKAARNLALAENSGNTIAAGLLPDRVLVSLAAPAVTDHLVELGVILKKDNPGGTIHALHVLEEGNDGNTRQAEKLLQQAVSFGAATDTPVVPLLRYDLDIVNGILSSAREYNFSAIITAFHRTVNDHEGAFGRINERLIEKFSGDIYIYQPLQPLNTVRRIIVAIPPNAEKEQGFAHWFGLTVKIARMIGIPVHFYGNNETLIALEENNGKQSPPAVAHYTSFTQWEDFLIFSRIVQNDDLFLIIQARKGSLSFTKDQEKLSLLLSRYFNRNNLLVAYPRNQRVDAASHNMHFDNTLINDI